MMYEGNPSALQETKLWIIQHVIELQDPELIQRLVESISSSIGTPSTARKALPKHIQTYQKMVDKAEEDISMGRVHSDEAIASWIDNLD